MGAPRKRLSSRRFWLIVLVATVLLVVAGVGGLRVWYSNNLRPVSSTSSQTVYFTVPSGSGLNEIASNLQRAGLIRSVQAFQTYVRSNESQDHLQAGTYSLSPSMSVQEIVNKMVAGDVAKNLLTILPGKRLDQVKEAFSKAGYSQPEIGAAFDPRTYASHPALASLPAGASLEGYLYPDSFQKITGTPAATIVRESLDEMQKNLTADIINSLANQGLNTYQGIILASIVYQETGDHVSDEPAVAQVFISRFKSGMALGSDVTAFYASDVAGVKRSLSIESPYNTRIHDGLPPGPISNFTIDALKAVAHPAGTDYLYFLAGDDGKIHFAHTENEHQNNIQQYCAKGCSQ